MEDRHGSAAADFQWGNGASLDEAESRPRGGKIKVLVVDDDPESLRDAAAVFRSGGFDTWTASSGGEALGILASEPDIRLLFTDVIMREMDGVTLGRKARALIPDIQVVLISLLPSLAMEAHAGEPGEFAFLMKPFFLSEVQLILRKQPSSKPDHET